MKQIIQNYLEGFVDWCDKNLDGPDKEIMERLLTLEADKRVINIALNSLNNPDLSPEDKLSLFPATASCTPPTTELSQVDDVEH